MLPITSKISIVAAFLLIVACQGDTTKMHRFAVHGIDVSHYQRRINWDTVAGQGIDFVFIKATEGAEYNDSIFHSNWMEVKRAGMKRGAYHFFRPGISARAQARNFMRHVSLEEGDLPPVLDVEVRDGVVPDRLVDSVRLWLDLVQEKLAMQPVLYSNLKFYDEYLSGHFADTPLWIARYYHQEPFLAGEKDWHFWQYGNRGRLAGIEGYVDFNVFNGTMEELEKLTRTTDKAVFSAGAEDYSETLTAP